MKSLWTTFLASALLVCAFNGGEAFERATAQIVGAVQDSSGAVLPGVEITATQAETGVSRMTVSNETGSYTLSNLPLGPYKLEASLPGFRSFVQTGIVLQVNSSPTLNITLQVGQVSEQVEVQANASLVETRNVSVGQVNERQHSQTKSVWRDVRRTGSQEQAVFLRRLSGYDPAPGSGGQPPVRADGRDACRRLYRLHLTGLQQRPADPIESSLRE